MDREFQILSRVLTRYHGGSRVGEVFAQGAHGVEAALKQGALEGCKAVHLWDASPEIAGRGLKAVGFLKAWTNHLLQARAAGMRSGLHMSFRVTEVQERAEIVRALGEENAPRRGARVLAARDSDGEIAGAVSFVTEEDVLYFGDLFVREDRRRSGCGRAIVDELARQAEAGGVIWLWALPTERARGFYERLGFEPKACVSTFLSQRPAAAAQRSIIPRPKAAETV